jgi:hypothetical protein
MLQEAVDDACAVEPGRDREPLRNSAGLEPAFPTAAKLAQNPVPGAASTAVLGIGAFVRDLPAAES